MLQTISYGLEHSFYIAGMKRLDAAPSAQYMYVGAAMCRVVTIIGMWLLVQLTREVTLKSEPQSRCQIAASVSSRSFNRLEVPWVRLEDELARHPSVKDLGNMEREPLLHGEARDYGTLLATSSNDRCAATRTVRLIVLTIATMFLLLIAQWLFWNGFINLASEEYVMRTLIPVMDRSMLT